jgi:hypothetical protein
LIEDLRTKHKLNLLGSCAIEPINRFRCTRRAFFSAPDLAAGASVIIDDRYPGTALGCGASGCQTRRTGTHNEYIAWRAGADTAGRLNAMLSASGSHIHTIAARDLAASRVRFSVDCHSAFKTAPHAAERTAALSRD